MVDPRGKLKTGMKLNNLPKSLDYFNAEKFPELREAYGEKPAAFVVRFPSDEPIDFFDCNFEHWAGRKADKETGTLIRKCDGEVCLHRINETIAGTTYGAGEESGCVCQTLKEDDKQRCKYVAYLKAWVVLPQTGKIENPLCYLFETHSQNSGDAIMSALNDVRILTGGTLRGIPFSLSVKMVSGKEDAKQKFPIWTLLPLGTVTQMREQSQLLTGATIPLLSRAPQAIEDIIARESRIIFERYVPIIKNCSTVAGLTKLKEEINAAASEGKLTQLDYDKLLDVGKIRQEELMR